MKYKSEITGKVWTEEEFSQWVADFYIPFETNIPGYTRPKDYKERARKILNLKEIKDVSK